MKLHDLLLIGALVGVYSFWRRDERKHRELDECVSDGAPRLVLSGGLELLAVVLGAIEDGFSVQALDEVTREAESFRAVVCEHVRVS